MGAWGLAGPLRSFAEWSPRDSWQLAAALLVLAVVTGLSLAIHALLGRDGMLFVQVLWFYVTTLRSSRATLGDFHARAAAAYAACGFERALTPREWEQLALHASFPPAAAAALARSLREAEAEAAGAHATSSATSASSAPAAPGGPRRGERAAARRSRRAAPLRPQLLQVTVPAWRMKYFLWWFNSHLETLRLLRAEWEQQSPQLLCGFDMSRISATAMLFRRQKGTCMVRLGMEVGGVIVSLRPDKHSLPDQHRTPESYYSSISMEQLAGQYEMEGRAEQRKRREGAVAHVYVPNSSLRMLGGLLGCLRRMKHTKLFLDVSAGETLPTRQAFGLLHPPPRPTPAQLHSLGQQVVQRVQRCQQEGGRVSEEAQRELEAWLRDALEQPLPQEARRRHQRRHADRREQELQWLLRCVNSDDAAASPRPHAGSGGLAAPPAAAAVAADDELRWLLRGSAARQASLPFTHAASGSADLSPSDSVETPVAAEAEAAAAGPATWAAGLAREQQATAAR